MLIHCQVMTHKKHTQTHISKCGSEYIKYNLNAFEVWGYYHKRAAGCAHLPNREKFTYFVCKWIQERIPQYLGHCLIIKKKTYTLHIYIKDLFHKQSITLIPQREKKIKRKKIIRFIEYIITLNPILPRKYTHTQNIIS